MDLLFLEITLVIVIATLLGIIANLLRQPTILGFILTGIIVGPLILQEVTPQILDVMARFGVTLLLFMVGLELSFRELKTVGKTVLIAGLGQILFTAVIGFFIALFLGFNLLVSFYISLALTFSSTIIVVKLLSDKGDLNSLYGKISVGLLLVQDLVAIFILIFLSGIEVQISEFPMLSGSLLVIFKGLLLFAIVFFLSFKFFPKIVDLIARSQELLFLVSAAWALGVAALVSSPLIGFSMEIGGLLAGLALANSSEHFQIAARIKPLRDFFLTIFFIILGMKVAISNLAVILFPSLIFSAFVLVGNPLILLVIMGLLGYRKRTSFLTGVTVAQVSEFSLILVILGNRIGHLTPDVVGIITLVGIITFTISTYMILYSNQLYKILANRLGVFERKHNLREEINLVSQLSDHVVLVGVNRMGRNIVKSLLENKEKFLVIDFNPDIIRSIREENVNALFGDVADPEVLESANLARARLVISTVPDIDDNLVLLSEIKRHNDKIKFIVSANSEFEAKKLYEAGADVVILPHRIGGEHIVQLLKYGNL